MCDFHASALLELRRSIAANKSLTTEAIKGVIDEIDRRRWDHQEQTGCECWYAAIASADRADKRVA